MSTRKNLAQDKAEEDAIKARAKAVTAPGSTAAKGPRSSIAHAPPSSAAPSAMRPPDMGARFAPQPPPGKKPAQPTRRDTESWASELDALND